MFLSWQMFLCFRDSLNDSKAVSQALLGKHLIYSCKVLHSPIERESPVAKIVEPTHISYVHCFEDHHALESLSSPAQVSAVNRNERHTLFLEYLSLISVRKEDSVILSVIMSVKMRIQSRWCNLVIWNPSGNWFKSTLTGKTGQAIPRCSMYGIFTYKVGSFMSFYVGKYASTMEHLG